MSYQTPETEHPHSWAYAHPYEGAQIVVFYDRIKAKMGEVGTPHLLAYVLAHEITHVLQGIAPSFGNRHMKAAWGANRYLDMGKSDPSREQHQSEHEGIQYGSDIRFRRGAGEAPGHF